jgi:hypothetical protein
MVTRQQLYHCARAPLHCLRKKKNKHERQLIQTNLLEPIVVAILDFYFILKRKDIDDISS